MLKLLINYWKCKILRSISSCSCIHAPIGRIIGNDLSTITTPSLAACSTREKVLSLEVLRERLEIKTADSGGATEESFCTYDWYSLFNIILCLDIVDQK